MKEHRKRSMLTWILLPGVVILITGHAVLLYYVVSHKVVSIAVASGVIVLIVIRHLGFLAPFFGLRRRRSR
jgi:hypothetical protein